MLARTPQSARRSPSRTIRKPYEFKDHDPIIDQVMTIIGLAAMTFKKLESLRAISSATLYKWEKRETKRPQFATVMRVVRACGGDVVVIYQGKKISRNTK